MANSPLSLRIERFCRTLRQMGDPMDDAIETFFAGNSFAVIGASRDREKYGNKVLRSYLQAGRRVYPVNPKVDEIEGLQTYPDLASLPERVHGISIITPPQVTADIVEQAARAGVRYLWMQPGAESEAAIRRAEELGLEVIHSGPCVLVLQGFRDV
jgi:predicted CoA-binding protein